MTRTTISWSTYTHQFWRGCTKVSAGCKYCYMHRIIEKTNYDPTILRKSPDPEFNSPRLHKNGEIIFVNSMSDFFHEDADVWRDDAWSVIRESPQHCWLILTKRPERVTQCLPADWVGNYHNVMLGVSIESQDYFYRLEQLAEVPDAKRFISAEPLIGPLKLSFADDFGIRPIDSFSWCIIGGESGEEKGHYRYRPCKMEWIEDLVSDLQQNASHVSLHVKQLGSHLQKELKLQSRHGSDPSEFPKNLWLRSRPRIPKILDLSAR